MFQNGFDFFKTDDLFSTSGCCVSVRPFILGPVIIELSLNVEDVSSSTM